jgi:minor histocompatibility antigen H13
MFIFGLFGIVHPYQQVFIIGAGLIYIGSIKSLAFFTKIQASEKPSILTINDVLKYPIYGSGIMLVLHFLIKKVDAHQVNMLLHLYFSYLGTISLKQAIFYIMNLRPSLASLKYTPTILLNRIKIMGFSYNLSMLDTVAFFFSAIIVAFYVFTGTWVSNNLIAYSFVFYILQNFYIGRFSTAIGMLVSCALYDAFWLYGTSVSYEVIKYINIPIFLKFQYFSDAGVKQHLIMGIGDVIIPGLFITMLFRFEFLSHIYTHKEKTKCKADECIPKSVSDFKKPIFFTTLICYMLSLRGAIYIMANFKVSLPALFLTGPACILSTVMMCIIYGKLPMMCGFEEEKTTKTILGIK